MVIYRNASQHLVVNRLVNMQSSFRNLRDGWAPDISKLSKEQMTLTVKVQKICRTNPQP